VSELRGATAQTEDLLLTPSNVGRVADQLAQMRGAAMKVRSVVGNDFKADILRLN